MIAIDLALKALPELIKIVTSIVEDPDTYKKLEAVRKFLSEVFGVEIEESALLAFVEEVTQGEGFTGKWEGEGAEDKPPVLRARIDGGYIYDSGAGKNDLLVMDK